MANELAHQKALYKALRAGDVQAAAEEVDFWKQQGAPTPFGSYEDEPNSPKAFYPLHYTASRGLSEIATLMIDAGADINVRFESCSSCSTRAFWNIATCSEKGRYLDLNSWEKRNLDAVAYRCIRMRKNQTPLMLACQALDVELVQLLVQRGADVQATDQEGYSVLHYAIWSRRERCEQQLAALKLLRKHSPHKEDDKGGHWALRDLCVERTTTMIEYLLAHGADVNANPKESPLSLAVSRGYPEITQLLLQYAPKELDARIHMCNLFYRAAKYPVELVKVLKDYVDIDWCNSEHHENPLYHACLSYQYHTAEQLLRWGFNPNGGESSRTSLHELRGIDSTEILELMLSWGADVNARNSSLSTLLHLIHDIERVELLLSWGANVNARDESGRTPLHKATYFEEADVAMMLLKHGADPNAQDKTGRSPLHEACSDVSEFTLENLLEAGGDVSIKDNDGRTAFDVCFSEDARDRTFENRCLCAREMLKKETDVLLLDKAVAGACAVILRSEPWFFQSVRWPEMQTLPCPHLMTGHMEGLALYKAGDGHSSVSPPSRLCYGVDGASFRQEASAALDNHRVWMLNHVWSHEDCYRVEYSGEQAQASDATAVVAILCIHACFEDNDALVHSATQGSIIKWHYQIYRRQLMNQFDPDVEYEDADEK